MLVVVLMEDLNRVVNNADLVADSRNILGNPRKSHFTRFAALFSVMMVYCSRPVGNDVDHVYFNFTTGTYMYLLTEFG